MFYISEYPIASYITHLLFILLNQYVLPSYHLLNHWSYSGENNQTCFYPHRVYGLWDSNHINKWEIETVVTAFVTEFVAFQLIIR